jgi:hypothetical protein
MNTTTMNTTTWMGGARRWRVTGAARDGRRTGQRHVSDPVAPLWVHRLHGDGLPLAEASAQTPLQDGSQRFVERWGRVADGY